MMTPSLRVKFSPDGVSRAQRKPSNGSASSIAVSRVTVASLERMRCTQVSKSISLSRHSSWVESGLAQQRLTFDEAQASHVARIGELLEGVESGCPRAQL